MALLNAINRVTAIGFRVAAQAPATIQVKSGALATPFELISPCEGHG